MDGITRMGHKVGRRLTALLCAAFFLACSLAPVARANPTASRVVRVGRFPYEEMLRRDESGAYSGYGYDYLRELSRYTGWTYEFVDAPWNECLQMLARGELDLMGAVMESPQRSAVLDFSSTPMISGYGVLATALSNDALPYEDFEAFEGLKVGALRGNEHQNTFQSYARENDFRFHTTEYDTTEEMSAALERGEIEAVIMTNLLRLEELRVVATFGENDAYFATTKGNAALLHELEGAMRAIRMEDPYFNIRLDQKYYDLQAATAISFTREELGYIRSAPPIPCVYIPDAVPFNRYDEKTGQVSGIAAQLCARLAEETGLRFTWLHPSSANEAVAMLRSGEALLLPAKHHDFRWAGENGLVLTDPYLNSQMVMVTAAAVSPGEEVLALYDQASQSHLAQSLVSAGARTRQYDTVLECVEAVLLGEANITYTNATIAAYLLGDLRYSQLRMTPLYGSAADVAMAVSGEADPLLMNVLNKGLRSISATEMNEIVLAQTKRENIQPLALFLYDHPIEILFTMSVIFLLLVLVLSVLLHHRRRSTLRMRKDLYTDPLTGYTSYHALTTDGAQLVRKRPGGYAMVYMDIHQFKVINDTFGYEVGDWVLIATADVLEAFIGPEERFARVYADTFALLLEYDGQASFRRRLEALSAELEALPVREKGITNLLFCGGVYPLPPEFDGSEFGKACDRANYAKDSTSRYYANTFVFYNDIMRSRLLEEKELEGSMASALENREFIPYYQPKVNALTGKVVGAEALVRWKHPQKGLLPPAEFLPFYEKNGFIVKIDLAMFEQVCRDLRESLDAGREPVPVSVNFSRRHMWDASLPTILRDIAARYGVPPALLEVEVTETEELEDTGIAVELVNTLKEMGFSVSIDDYGTGYSSISFLQQVPLTALKLDRDFILHAMDGERGRDVMNYLVAAMHKNCIRVICEGVETAQQRDFVVSLNCRYIQGYYYAPPLPREEFLRYIDAHGVDTDHGQDFLSIGDFEENRWVGAEDFVTKAMPSWVFSCLDTPGYPVYYISPNFLRGLGYSELEFQAATGGSYLAAVHPDDLDQVLAQVEEERAGEQEVRLQYRVRRKDGGYLWVREVNRRILTGDGRAALLGVCTDVSDMVACQQGRESAERNEKEGG